MQNTPVVRECFGREGKNLMDTNSIPQKTCTRCGESKPATLEFFTTDRGNLSSRCKVCRNAQKKVDRENNPEKIREQKKRSHEKNRDKDNARVRRWFAENKEHVTEYRKKQYQENRDVILQRSLLYQKNNPEYVKARWNRRRALELAAEGNFTTEDLKLQYKSQRGKCWWCGKKLGTKWHADHLTPLARGGGNGARNIVIACPTCNCSRGAKLPHEWSDRLF